MNVMKRKLPLGAVGLVLVLVLAAVGIVVGNWTQSLSINGTVNTAQINAQWYTDVPTKSCGDNDTKGVALTTRALENPVDDGAGAAKSNKVIITTTNAYPKYDANCSIGIKNNGKLPVRVGGITFKPVGKDGLSDLTDCIQSDEQIGIKGAVLSAEWTCAGQLKVIVVNGAGQILPGQTDGFTISLRVLKPVPKTNLAFQLNFCVEPAVNDNGSCA